MAAVKNVFITGKPGSGKSTLIREACLPFRGRVGGFYTEELRGGSARLGFVLKTFDGKEGVLAKKGMKSACTLNKYGIDLSVLEGIGIGALRSAMENNRIIVIDEIGSMEVLSEAFRQTFLSCLASPCHVLATIRYNSQPFTDEVKRMSDTELITLTRDNFRDVKDRLREWMSAWEKEKREQDHP